MSLWIKNTSGKPDAVLTMTLLGFVAILFKFVLSGVSAEIAGVPIDFGDIDASSIAALLTPTLGAYVARRYTDTKYDVSEEK